MPDISVNGDLCKKCGTCVATCPETVLYQAEKRTVPLLQHADLCLSCGQCVAVCPAGAITHSAFPEGTILPLDQDHAPDPAAVLELVRTRRSVRAFRDAPVEKEQLEAVLEAARFAPSAHNNQTTAFTVVTDADLLARIVRLTAANITETARLYRDPAEKERLLAENRDEVEGTLYLLPDLDRIIADTGAGQDTVLFNAPAVILFHAHRTADMGTTNAQLCAAQAMLAAHAMGLGTFYAGYVTAACRQNSELAGALALPDGHVVQAALAVGRPKFKYRYWMQRNPAQVRWL